MGLESYKSVSWRKDEALYILKYHLNLRYNYNGLTKVILTGVALLLLSPMCLATPCGTIVKQQDICRKCLN